MLFMVVVNKILCTDKNLTVTKYKLLYDDKNKLKLETFGGEKTQSELMSLCGRRLSKHLLCHISVS